VDVGCGLWRSTVDAGIWRGESRVGWAPVSLNGGIAGRQCATDVSARRDGSCGALDGCSDHNAQRRQRAGREASVRSLVGGNLEDPEGGQRGCVASWAAKRRTTAANQQSARLSQLRFSEARHPIKRLAGGVRNAVQQRWCAVVAAAAVFVRRRGDVCWGTVKEVRPAVVRSIVVWLSTGCTGSKGQKLDLKRRGTAAYILYW
jgi:hypothetical protein